ncbi:MAG TPA: DUF389 domain-containing protein [Candidatus Saccharimonadales bacterium]
MTSLKQTTHFPETSKRRAAAGLLKDTRGSLDFLVLLLGSIVIATGAIFTDSIPVLIASMIIAPLATPILAMGLGIVTGQMRLFVRSGGMLFFSIVIALVSAAILTLLFDENAVKDTYISFSGDKVIAVGIALVAGYIGAYGLLSKRVAGAITGVAIAVSLMPPLVATSISFVTGDTVRAAEAGILFGLNVLGILIASVIAFWQFGLKKKHLVK